ncbi:MAG: 30S ribosomal protein S1 [Deltaproteobacteria bacterium ADurb.Bin510]|nr:MAG: 30S ribosomal protein S1 [Deltaproteobacteria bacterium ADurb.Bin510]
MIARERGLQPLADLLLEQAEATDPLTAAAAYVDNAKEVPDAEAALAGARDIIAETLSEDADLRAKLRRLFEQEASLTSEVFAGLEEQAATYRDYFNWSERAATAPSHRVLAMLRGWREVFLKLSIRPPEERGLELVLKHCLKAANACSAQVELAASDGLKRLLLPSLENEYRASLKSRADEEAIQVFARNLRELLMAAPLGSKRVLAIDPGYRTGCKLVCLDEQGGLRHHAVIYPTQSEKLLKEAEATVRQLAADYAIEAVAIGNGTASRETESFVRGLNLGLPVVMVSESGASIYSASEVARREFPDQDVTVRGAVSIGRRLMDPLAELVKLDPKSIGVGQYQHDVDQTLLKQRLDEVVMSCVNAVGVELNTASRELLAYVSGLGPALAENIVAYRAEHGGFKSRQELLKVPRLGPKAFEQAAGFLRVSCSLNPLDASAVHPERYALVEQMARDCACTVAELIASEDQRRKLDLRKYLSAEVGLPTLKDILDELRRPGRDPRAHFEIFSFLEGVSELKHLSPGMELPGLVTNVTNFGAFVDIGVHQDGLVHISQLADRFVKDPNTVVKVGQPVTVRVIEVDLKRSRIALSMRGLAKA